MKKSREKSKRHIVVGISVVILALVVLVVIATIVTLSVANTPITWRERAPDLRTREITGKVTRINTNSRDYIIDENGEKAPGPLHGITHTGDAIYVDGQLFQASSGDGKQSRFHIDIESIELGEMVTVSYGVKETGEKTLNCKQCAVSRVNP